MCGALITVTAGIFEVHPPTPQISEVKGEYAPLGKTIQLNYKVLRLNLSHCQYINVVQEYIFNPESNKKRVEN